MLHYLLKFKTTYTNTHNTLIIQKVLVTMQVVFDLFSQYMSILNSKKYYGNYISEIYKYFLTYCPVYDFLFLTTSSGVPLAITVPPLSPPSGPMSMI